MPADLGAAFILVLHLDPTRSSQLAEILQRHTDRLSVEQVNGTVRLEANRAYVIAPNSKLLLVDGSLVLEPLRQKEVRGHLVDYLFSSLAAVEGAGAVGIVLSGGGSDGTEGLRRIRAAGGLGIAQDPIGAAAKGMPQSAIDAGVVDAVLEPARIPAALVAFLERGVRSDPAYAEQPEADGDTEVEPTDGFQRILDELAARFDVDFGDYKAGMLERRARRRMGLLGIGDWGDYAVRLAAHADELDALYRDLLIGVTEFFRDPPVWEQLAAELAGALDWSAAPGVRAWVPGSATGEEAYTLAMVLLELAPLRSRGKIQIYATDLNESALAIARRGVYAARSVEAVAPERRRQFFRQLDGHVQVDRRVRDCVTFAAHNVLRDPPFSKIDVVCCRNLLIYLKPHAHERLLKRLHFALRTGGLLLLGHAETVGRQTALFEEVSKRNRVFRSRAAPMHERFHFVPRALDRPRIELPPSAPPAAPFAQVGGTERRIERFVLREHAPACVAVDSALQIRFLYGPTQRYLLPPTGESRQDLLAWIPPELHVRLRTIVDEAVASGLPLATDGQIERDGGVQRVHCSVEALPAGIAPERLFLVTFRDQGEPVTPKLDAADPRESLVRELEQELIDGRRELQGAIEQLEASDAEHRAAHEELQSLNEELQSTNEELEASKEELEALNEEMNTINRELEEKNSELRTANDDLRNLLASTGIPTVFLDRDLNVRRFTSAASEVLRLVPSDVGRSIEHVKERFADGDTAERCRSVLQTLEPDSSDVWTEDGRCFVRRVLPYETEAGEVQGVCITFSDVTAEKRSAQASETARAFAEEVIATARTPLVVVDRALRIVSANRSFAALAGVSEPLVGTKLTESSAASWSVPGLRDVLATLLSERADIHDFDATSNGRAYMINARRVRDNFQDDMVVLSVEDVTQQREAFSHVQQRAIELDQDSHRKDEWIAMLGHELRNPVAAISNAVQMLRVASLPEGPTRVVALIERQVLQVRRMLDDLLDAARIISGKLAIQLGPVDLTKVGEWAVEGCAPMMDEKEHEFVVTLPPAGSLWVLGDSARLQEMVVNLLTNAAKFTDRGGRVELAIAADGDTATITVADTGSGVSSELLPHIFETFTQGPRTLERAEGGLGLGLPLVRAVARLHGGEVAVSSREGQGSEFRVTLPHLRDGAAQRAPAPQSSAQATPKRVLIVDDNRDSRESLAALLQMRGHETRAAEDGPEALQAVRDFGPEIILLDLGLPGMDGYEVARLLRAAVPDATLVAVTGYAKDPSRLATSEFDHYFIKPVDVASLTALLSAERR